MDQDTPKYIRYQKLVGETPLEALNRLKSEKPELQNVRLAYAGRLDPQASGELLILVGEECKKRDHYQGLDKVYTFELLIGVSTDTGDIMGEITQFNHTSKVSESEILTTAKGFEGNFDQEFPVYSSKAVDGKPLWQWAKEGRLDEIKIPTHPVTVHNIELIGSEKIKSETVFHEIESRINKVTGDFRQAEIIEHWKEKLTDGYEIQTFKLEAKVGSGTYIRQLAFDFSKKLRVPMCCWSIHRNSINI